MPETRESYWYSVSLAKEPRKLTVAVATASSAMFEGEALVG